jgi:hypothetical protein
MREQCCPSEDVFTKFQDVTLNIDYDMKRCTVNPSSTLHKGWSTWGLK